VNANRCDCDNHVRKSEPVSASIGYEGFRPAKTMDSFFFFFNLRVHVKKKQQFIKLT